MVYSSIQIIIFTFNLGPTEPIPGTIEEEKSDDGKVRIFVFSIERNGYFLVFQIMVFGLNLKDPQDIITIFLGSVIVVNTLDIALFWVKKLFGGSE